MNYKFSCKTNTVTTLGQSNRSKPCKSYVGLELQNGTVSMDVQTSKNPIGTAYSISKRFGYLYNMPILMFC